MGWWVHEKALRKKAQCSARGANYPVSETERLTVGLTQANTGRYPVVQ